MPSYEAITEAPGEPATRPQVMRIIDRYRLVGDHGAGRRVLEVACGTGIGLRAVASRSALAVGGDVDSDVLHTASRHGREQHLLRMDAQHLPFRDGSFDVVAILEAIYYLPDAAAFVREARRVLAPGGVLIITSANPDRPDLARSPHSVRYYGASALLSLAESGGFHGTILGAFPASEGGLRGKVIGLARLVVTRLNLIPGTLRARSVLKRLAYGPLEPLPGTLDERAYPVPPPTPITPERSRDFVILHLVASAVG